MTLVSQENLICQYLLHDLIVISNFYCCWWYSLCNW